MQIYKSRLVSVALAGFMAIGVAVSAAPAVSATTATGPGGTVISTSATICHTHIDATLGSLSQYIDLPAPGLTSQGTMPSNRARWTAWIQYKPTKGGDWTNMKSPLSTIGTVSNPGFGPGAAVHFSSMSQQLGQIVPSGQFYFRVQNWFQFIDGAGNPVGPGSGWILGDELSTNIWITGQGLGNDTNFIAWGYCLI